MTGLCNVIVFVLYVNGISSFMVFEKSIRCGLLQQGCTTTLNRNKEASVVCIKRQFVVTSARTGSLDILKGYRWRAVYCNFSTTTKHIFTIMRSVSIMLTTFRKGRLFCSVYFIMADHHSIY